MPSAAEIQAYLDRSAARTKKRLPLAMGKSDRVEAVAARTLEVIQGAPRMGKPVAGAEPEQQAAQDGEEEATWRPFDADAEE